jgi:hypothetical protein
MENFFTDNTFSIGNTPLVKINHMAKGLFDESGLPRI